MGEAVLLQTPAHVQLVGLGHSVREVLYTIAQFVSPQFNLESKFISLIVTLNVFQ